jgi:hypothetical protein
MRRDIETLRAQLFAETEKVKALKMGNTRLLDALADMANQHFYRTNGTQLGAIVEVLTDGGLSANENAADVLIDAGIMKRIVEEKDWYKIDWDALEERRKSMQST